MAHYDECLKDGCHDFRSAPGIHCLRHRASPEQSWLDGRVRMVCGDFREHDVSGDVLVCDPPYLGARGESWQGPSAPLEVPYEPATTDLLSALVRVGCRGWRVIFNDFPGCIFLREEMAALGLVVTHAPGVWCKPPGAFVPAGSANSLPKSVDFLALSRPTNGGADHQRRGYYISPPYNPATAIHHTGGKPLSVMMEIVRDFSDDGDVIVDPCAGAGTTLLAAMRLGRGAVGYEIDRPTYEKACSRITQALGLGLLA